MALKRINKELADLGRYVVGPSCWHSYTDILRRLSTLSSQTFFLGTILIITDSTIATLPLHVQQVPSAMI